jgi:hypothetical protein
MQITKKLTRILTGVGDNFSVLVFQTSEWRLFVICVFIEWNWRVRLAVGWINTAWNETSKLVTVSAPNPIWQTI